MNNNVSTIGIIIAGMNILILILLISNIYLSYRKASDIDKAVSADDVDFYFMQMFNSMVFFVANAIATYTGIIAFIVHPYLTLDSIVMWRLADRFAMLCTAIMLILIRRKYNPFNK